MLYNAKLIEILQSDERYINNLVRKECISKLAKQFNKNLAKKILTQRPNIVFFTQRLLPVIGNIPPEGEVDDILYDMEADVVYFALNLVGFTVVCGYDRKTCKSFNPSSARSEMVLNTIISLQTMRNLQHFKNIHNEICVFTRDFIENTQDDISALDFIHKYYSILNNPGIYAMPNPKDADYCFYINQTTLAVPKFSVAKLPIRFKPGVYSIIIDSTDSDAVTVQVTVTEKETLECEINRLINGDSPREGSVPYKSIMGLVEILMRYIPCLITNAQLVEWEQGGYKLFQILDEHGNTKALDECEESIPEPMQALVPAPAPAPKPVVANNKKPPFKNPNYNYYDTKAAEHYIDLVMGGPDISKKLEDAYNKGSEDAWKSMEEEWDSLQNQCDESATKVANLRSINEHLQNISTTSGDVCLTSTEKDYRELERYGVIIEALQYYYDSMPEQRISRRKDIIKDILDNNPIQDYKNEKQEIKNILMHPNINKAVIKDMAAHGFSHRLNGETHHVFTYRDDQRYQFTCASTAGDRRTLNNFAAELLNAVF